MATVAPIWDQMGGVLQILDDPAPTEEDHPTPVAPASMVVNLLILEAVEMVHLPDTDLHHLVFTATTDPAQVAHPALLDLLALTGRQDLVPMGLRTDLRMLPKDKWLIANLYQDRCLDPRHLVLHHSRIPRAIPCPAAAASPQTRSSITMRSIRVVRHLAKEPRTLKGDHRRLADWRVMRAIKAVTTMTTLLQPASETL
jgi:hypothetical protein